MRRWIDRLVGRLYCLTNPHIWISLRIEGYDRCFSCEATRRTSHMTGEHREALDD